MTGENRDYSQKGFLIVDDKLFIRSLVQSILLKCGVKKLRHAGSGDEAMHVMSSHSAEIDCVICDWNMEPINGLELLKMLRTGSIANARPDLQFVMLTGHADSAVVTTAISLDVHGYLVKPVSVEKLIKAIDNAFGKKLTLKAPEEYIAVQLGARPKTMDGPSDKAPPSVFWPRSRDKRQEMARRLGQIRKEATELLKKQAETGEKKKRIINARKIKLSEATVGMVIAEDLLTPDGTLLVGGGIGLSTSLIGRLREVASGKEDEIILSVGDLAPS